MASHKPHELEFRVRLPASLPLFVFGGIVQRVEHPALDREIEVQIPVPLPFFRRVDRAGNVPGC